MTPFRFSVVSGLVALAISAAGQVSATEQPATSQVTLDAVTVTGSVPGPGLWQVHKDEGHTLWILGVMHPTPARIEWDSESVLEVLNRSQTLVLMPMYGVDIKSNLFQQASLGIRYLRAKNNPDKQRLRDVLDPELYARWQRVKKHYMPRNNAIEKKRPVVAAEKLMEAATRRASLSDKDFITPILVKEAKKNDIKIIQPYFTVHLTTAQAREALGEVRSLSLNDNQCLSATLDAVEQDIPRMITNANAWATGEVDQIQLGALARREALCHDALMSEEFSTKHGLPNIEKSIEDVWFERVEKAVQGNEHTLAILPMKNLIGPNNYLERLRAQGYQVIAP